LNQDFVISEKHSTQSYKRAEILGPDPKM